MTGHLAMLARLPAVERGLRGSASVPELFAHAAAAACRECGFDRGVVLTIDGDHLTAAHSGVLADPASDALRRRVLAGPITLTPGSAEAEAIRRPDMAACRAASTLPAALGLTESAIGVIAPDDRALALLVLARDRPAVGEVDRAVVAAFGAVVAVALSAVLARARVTELSAELRYLTASAQALTAELLEAPMSLPSERGRGGPTFPRVEAVDSPARDALLGRLNARERQIAELMVLGRSNREIAGELMLSPETVKDYVARVLRKLGAANRVEAASRLLAASDQ
jgi:DNA-binding CsgD family transcriptional regulator